MKELFKKRLKKLTALVVALVMMLLPGQSLMVIAAKTYKAEDIVSYVVNTGGDPYYYSKILKPGDTITGNNHIITYFNVINDTMNDNKEVTVEEYKDIKKRIEDFKNSSYSTEDTPRDYGLLNYLLEFIDFTAPYFKGWEVYNVYPGNNNNADEIVLKPVLQFVHVDNPVVLNTEKEVKFTATYPHPDSEDKSNVIEYYNMLTPRWGYVEKLDEGQSISEYTYGETVFINPEDNQFYSFEPIMQDDNYVTSETLTLSMEEAKGKIIVCALTPPEPVALYASPEQSIPYYDDYMHFSQYYFSNLAQAKINYSVSYVKPDGTKLFKDDTGNSLEEFEITKTPSVDGYTFEGWYDNAKCTGTKITSIPEGNTKNVTLYAKLTKKPATKPSTDTPSSVSKKTYEKNSTTMTLAGKIYWDGKKLVVKWGNVPGADGYDIIATRCGKSKMSNKLLVKTVPAGTTKTFLSKIDGKKLNLIKSYKVQIKAFVGSGTSKQYIGESMVYHSAGKNSPFTNAKKVTIGKKKLTLKTGQTFKLSPKTKKQNKNKKLLSANHAPLYRYLSSDTSVATVNAKGKIKAVGTGSCTITVIAINGVNNSIQVTVK